MVFSEFSPTSPSLFLLFLLPLLLHLQHPHTLQLPPPTPVPTTTPSLTRSNLSSGFIESPETILNDFDSENIY